MKQFIFISLFLLSFLGVRLAEFSCLCIEDTQLAKTSEVQVTDHHEHSESEESHEDHCQHLCSDCHFAALIPVRMPEQFFSVTEFKLYLFSSPSPEERALRFLRPPIFRAV